MMVWSRRAPNMSDTGIDLRRHVGDRADAVSGKSSTTPRYRAAPHTGRIRLGFRLGQDALEIVARERLQLDANGKPALQLGQKIRGLGGVERA